MLASVTLQSAKIISVAELRAQLLENVPIVPLMFGTNLPSEIFLEIGNDAVVIE